MAESWRCLELLKADSSKLSTLHNLDNLGSDPEERLRRMGVLLFTITSQDVVSQSSDTEVSYSNQYPPLLTLSIFREQQICRAKDRWKD